MSVAGLLLGDSRFPAGGHAYSGGVEPAVTAGSVTDLHTLEVFLRGRLRTAGLVAAGLAAAACAGAAACARAQMTKYPEFRGAVFAPEIPDSTDSGENASDAGEPDSTDSGENASDAGEPDSTDSGENASDAHEPDSTDSGEGPRDAGELGRVEGAVEDAGSALASEQGNGARGGAAAVVRDYRFWAELDGEADARTPAPPQREASRRQGRALLRATRVAWPDAPWLAELAASVRADGTREAGRSAATGAAVAGSAVGRSSATHTADGLGVGSRRADAGAGVALGGAGRREYRGGPHHAVVLGAAAAAAGCTPVEAARIAAYQAVAGPVSAAVRLLALDPMRATGILAGLAGDIEQVAAQGARYADGPLGELPCASAPALDLLAETHTRAEVRLFES